MAAAIVPASLQNVGEADQIGVDIGMRILSEYRTPACAARWMTTGNRYRANSAGIATRSATSSFSN